MKDFYGQKEIPDIKIKNTTIDILTSFDLYYNSDDCTEIIFTTQILTKQLKKQLLKGDFRGAKLKVMEIVRQEDGTDVIQPLVLKIKKYNFEYHLGCENEPAHYEFRFECDYE